ncbi:MAG: gliding motility-associated C-terminal domain-containing protein, partial [Bacteroidota bacterium]
YSFTDANVDRGKEYCYRVEAEFADTTAVPNVLINFCEGLPSNEDCAMLKKDVPVITNASVNTTDAVNGSIYVAWSKPSAIDLDTLQNPGPYEYRIFHSTGFTGANLSQINSIVAPTFTLFSDTTFTDTLINTVANAYSYKIEFYSNSNKLGETEIASSVFVNGIGQDRKVVLSWSENVPWTNTLYTIYRQNKITSSVWDSIGISSIQSYTDKGLLNDSTYCYYVKSTGGYSAPGIISPIINFSQRICVVPVDTVGPCPPTLQVTNDCLDPNFSFGAFNNFLSWNLVHDECANDLLHYNIYYSPTDGGDFVLIDSSIVAFDTTFLHDLKNTVAGCYYITGTDSNYNEGTKSNLLCVDVCPHYELPNVFTPNGDEQNDVFHPFPPVKYIDKIDIKIFDNWGVLVFETSDPNINWDGINIQNGKMCADGTYYYVCDVYEQSLAGSVKRSKPLSGFIHLYK